MCGIVGFAGVISADILRNMNSVQNHRGPDDTGYYINENSKVSLAMTRLSIVDIMDGHQPMSNFREDVWIVFNGEIFNSNELRENLLKEGYSFKTHHSDTEVLIYMYEHFGMDMLTYLNGMFAFVIYDLKKDKLFAARDRFGIKPFYYSTESGYFTFASELKSFARCPWIENAINNQAVFDYFTFQTVPAPQTILSSINKLPAGHLLEYNIAFRQAEVKRYWAPELSKKAVVQTDVQELKHQIKESFLQAVKRWSQSDVEIACSLSGGIDSSALVAAVALTSSYRIKTYTVGFTDAPEMDEKLIARKVAEKWNTDHHEIIVRSDELLESLEDMVYYLDEPYAGGLPSWFVYEAMQKNVKVAMTGTGGDELFGNYGKWRFYESKRDYFYRVRQYLKNGGKIMHSMKYPNGALHYPYFTDGYKISKIFLPEFIDRLRPSAALVQQQWLGSFSAVDSVANIDLQLQLPEEFLHMTDRFSMANNIEARTPFLDTSFSDLILALPASLRTSKQKLKYLFIESIYDWLPREVITGPKKGFTLPLAKWLKYQLREKVEFFLSEKYIREQGIFQPNVYKNIAAPFYADQRPTDWQLWTILMFQLWYDQFVIKSNAPNKALV